MPEILRLEFACTDAERKHAESLHLQRQVGGGSKVLTTIVLLLVLAGMLLGFYVRVQREVPAAYRPYAYAGAMGCALLAWFWLRRSRQSAPVMASVDISDDGLAVRGPGGEARMPWSAFSRLLESPELFVLVDRSGKSLLPIPRRAFPDEGWQDWFRTLATNRLNLAERLHEGVPVASPHADGRSICLEPRLGFRECLDLTLASWLTRGLIAVISALLIGITLFLAMNPPPDAVYSTTQVFFMFVLPFLLVMMTFVVLLRSAQTWWAHSRGVVPRLSLSPGSISFSGADGSGTLPWTTYDRFKETRRSFLLWNSRTSAWLMFPKRAFISGDDVGWCREILSGQLQPSGWFFG